MADKHDEQALEILRQNVHAGLFDPNDMRESLATALRDTDTASYRRGLRDAAEVAREHADGARASANRHPLGSRDNTLHNYTAGEIDIIAGTILAIEKDAARRLDTEQET